MENHEQQQREYETAGQQWAQRLGLFGGIAVMIFTPFFGAIIFIGCAIGTLVVSILKLIYLYRTAVIFRDWPAET